MARVSVPRYASIKSLQSAQVHFTAREGQAESREEKPEIKKNEQPREDEEIAGRK